LASAKNGTLATNPFVVEAGRGYNVNSPPSDGHRESLLHYAFTDYDGKISDSSRTFLLQNGADVNVVDEYGHSVLESVLRMFGYIQTDMDFVERALWLLDNGSHLSHDMLSNVEFGIPPDVQEVLLAL
jgi:ankyrin repeat protein